MVRWPNDLQYKKKHDVICADFTQQKIAHQKNQPLLASIETTKSLTATSHPFRGLSICIFFPEIHFQKCKFEKIWSWQNCSLSRWRCFGSFAPKFYINKPIEAPYFDYISNKINIKQMVAPSRSISLDIYGFLKVKVDICDYQSTVPYSRRQFQK